MDYELMQETLQTVRIAKLFYEYGKLDRLLGNGVKYAGESLYDNFYAYFEAIADYFDLDFHENYEVDHWYFSFRSMVQYYHLCRDYSCLFGVKLRDNPYVRKAEAALADAFYDCSCNGGLGWGYAKKCNGAWSSGVFVEMDCYFHSEYELLEALLAIDDWYTEECKALEALLQTAHARQIPYAFRLEAA